ncbi:MAG: TRAP transporter substrate-binding protein [Rhodospirillales bacterium]|nr:TRAP transporter substrate-binding protein [Rhodospirillales bacterium]
MKSLLTLGLAAIIGAALIAPAHAAEMTLRFGHGTTVTDPHHLATVRLAERVKELTKGAIEIEIFPNSQLGTGRDILEGVLLGTVDMSQPAAAIIANRVPELNVLEMPFLFRDVNHYEAVWQGPIAAKVTDLAATKGIRFIGMYTSGERHIMTKRPVNSIADLKDMKIRTVENPIHVATFKAFGANATAISYAELYGALQTGVVDGADAANTNYLNIKFYEVAPSWALVTWLTFSNLVIMSDRKFQALKPEYQQAILTAGKEVGAYQRKLYRDGDAGDFEKLKAIGVKVTKPDQAPFREASKKIYDEFLKTDTQKDLLKAIVETK